MIKKIFDEFIAYLSSKTIIFITTCLAFFFACLRIYNYESKLKLGPQNIQLFLYFCAGFILATIILISVTFLTEKLPKVKQYIIQSSSAIIGFLLGFFALKYSFGFSYSYRVLFYGGLILFFITLAIFVLYPKEKSRTYFAGLFKYSLFTFFMTLILTGGIFLLIFALQLIFPDIANEDSFLSCAAFTFIIFFANSFIFYLFKNREEENSGKAIKVIVLYILFPIFGFLIAILYLYLLKALFTWTLPVGSINWFVSFTSACYLLFYFVLKQYDDLPVVKFFYRFGAFFVIPLICVQIYTYFVRFSAYGFTDLRYASLLYIIFSIISIALVFIKKGKYTKYSIVALAFFIFIGTLTPLNVFRVAYNNQISRIVKVLNKYDMYDKENQKLKAFDREQINIIMTQDDKEIIYSAFSYIRYYADLPHPSWLTSDKSKSTSEGLKDSFGIIYKK